MQTTREETWLNAAAKRVVLVISLIILLLLSAMALFETTGAATPYQEDVRFSADHPLLGFAAAGILGILCAALVFWIVPKQIQTKAEKRRVCLFMLLKCAAELGLCASWLWNGNYLPGGTDMGKVYSAACLIAEDGNFAFVQETYFRIYPFQTGGALFFATIFQLLGSTDYRILLALNGLSALLCVYLNYKIADLAFGSVRVNVLTMFCTAAFFPMAFLTSMIYGDLPSWVLCWLSVWLTMKALKGESADLRWLVPVPFCLLLANVIRGVALLWCLSIGIVMPLASDIAAGRVCSCWRLRRPSWRRVCVPAPCCIAMWSSAPAILWIKGPRKAAGSPWACRKEDGAAGAITPGAKTSIPYILTMTMMWPM